MDVKIKASEAESVSESFRYYGFQLLRDSDAKFRSIATMDLCFRISSALSEAGAKTGYIIVEIPDDYIDVVAEVISRYIFIEAEDSVDGDERWLDAMMSVYRQASGVKPLKVIFVHTLRNALIPVITYVGPLIASILTGSLVVEKIFTIGGLGSKFVDSITNRDYTMIMGATIFLATIMVIMNLLSDIVYKIVDPRIKLD